MSPRRRSVLPSEEDKARAVRNMFDAIAPRYDLLNRLLTFGMDMRWRREAIASLGSGKGRILADVACGTGDLCRIAEDQGWSAVGLDYSEGMLRKATTSSPLVQADALRLPLEQDSVDAFTCGFALRNVTSIALLFGEAARVVRPGGRIAILEVATPSSTLVRRGHHLYMHRLVPMIGGLLSDRDAYRYLPQSTVYLPSTIELLRMLEEAGFSGTASRIYAFGAAQLLTGVRS